MSKEEMKTHLRKNILESEQNRAFQIYVTSLIIAFTLATFTLNYGLNADLGEKSNMMILSLMLLVVVITILYSIRSHMRYVKMKKKVYKFIKERDPEFEFIKKKMEE